MARTGTSRPVFRLLAVAFGCLFAVLIAETAMRVAPVGDTSRSTKLEFQHKPPGPDFRGRSYETAKKPDVFRILAVGDSYTWGHGLYPEDAYPDRLARRLRSGDPSVEYEVINWSLPGWATRDELRSLRLGMSNWSPDLLLLGFVLNDPEPWESSKLSEIRRPIQRRKPEGAISRWLYAHSRVYSGTFEALENRRMRRALVAYYHGLFEGEHWIDCQDALKKIRNLARREKIPLQVVLFPIFDSPLDHRYRYRDLHDRVRGDIRKLGIPVFDLLPVYEGIEGRRLALEPYTDPHPSELANRIAADAILRRLVNKKLIPTRRIER